MHDIRLEEAAAHVCSEIVRVVLGAERRICRQKVAVRQNVTKMQKVGRFAFLMTSNVILTNTSKWQCVYVYLIS